MATILIIDTALERGGVGLYQNHEALGVLYNESQRDHAGFVQPAIDQIMKNTGVALTDIDVVAVVAGPGSYTGLRVGLSTAKGLCYALDKQLILINTLDAMALASIKAMDGKNFYYVPMIDARREDVFTGLYDNQRQLEVSQQAMTLSAEAFQTFSSKKKMILSGSGASKASQIIKSDNILVLDTTYDLSDVCTIAEEEIALKNFADVAYSEPDYLKAFYSTAQPNKQPLTHL